MIANGDNLSATCKIGFIPVIDKAIKTKTGLEPADKDGVINAIKGSTEIERNEIRRVEFPESEE
jgi:hypothetical protein